MRILDVCCAPGGASLGFKAALEKKEEDLEIIGVDLDKYGLLTYQTNHAGQAIRCDIRFLPFKEGCWFDLIIGGVPCQGFSSINIKARQKGYDPRNDLIFVFAVIIKKLQPLYFMFENVPGLRSWQKGSWFRRLLHQFYRSGYHYEWRLINAVHYGVPQDRRRIIVLGWMKGLERAHFPTPTNYCPSWERCLECGPYVLMEKIKDYPNVKQYGRVESSG